MILLSLARRNAVYGSRTAITLVETDYRSCCILRNHKTAVKSRRSHKETWESTRTRNKLVDTTFGDIGQLAERYGKKIHRQCNGLAMEISGRNDEVILWTYRRIVRSRVYLSINDTFHVVDGIFCRSMHLGHTTERIRVLYVRLGLKNDFTAFKKFAHGCRSINLPLMRTNLVDSVNKRLNKPEIGIKRKCSDYIGPTAKTAALKQCPYGERTHILSSV